MPNVLLARHGQTDWNHRYLFQGQSDLPLNDSGQAQASALAKRLATQSIQRLINSNLQRAFRTAEIIAAVHPDHPQAEVDPRLREIDYGRWDGLNEAGIEQVMPGEVQRWKHDPSFAPSGGESIVAVMARLEGLVAELRALPSDQTIVLVGHGGVFQVLLCLALDVLPRFWWPFRLSNASLSAVALHPQGATIQYLNDKSHLV